MESEMRNIDEHTITPAILGRLQGCADPRLQEVLAALVRHLHDFAREVKLTEAEWQAGIEFLTATGQMCDGTRQEFILLSDTLGLSMLTVALNNARPTGATQATVFGPFHVKDAPELPQGSDISAGAGGELLFVDARVSGPAGEPVAAALVDIWQADDEGFYDVQRPELAGMRGRAVMRTDAQGRLQFCGRLPVAYTVPTDGPVGKMLAATGRHPWRPAHIHFMLRGPGYETLITHVFRDGDPYLDSDVVFGVRSSLVGRFDRHEAGQAPDGSDQAHPFHTLAYEFVLAPQRP
jgi:hydroxyquinol 1,2-dioxygenase